VDDTLALTGDDGVARSRLRVGAERDTVRVSVFLPGLQSRGVTFRAVGTAAPVLRSVSPTPVRAGDTVTVRGTSFNASPSGNAVFFGPARGRVVSTSGDSVLRVVVPPCTPAGQVAVRVAIGTASTNSLSVATGVAGTPLALRQFEAVTVSGLESSGCLRLAGDGARYLVVPQFASVGETAPTTRGYELFASTAATTAADPLDVGAGRPLVPASAPRPRTHQRFERMLRAHEHALAPGAADAADEARARRAPPLNALTLGSSRTFRVLSDLDGTDFASSVARLRYIGDHILVYVDDKTIAPFTEPELKRLGDLFDRTLYPLDASTFGAESDIDGNGRVIVLMTPIVNALTPRNECSAEGFVPGFFYGFDLASRSSNSNRGEIFYTFVPDPAGTFSCAHSANEVRRISPRTFIHELQHMISYNQHVLARRGSDEDVWLNEGLSHIAEELGARYYDARYPAGTGRSIPGQLLPDSAVDFIRGNLENAYAYLSSLSDNSVTTYQGFGTLEERGATWLFLRWLATQKGEGVFARLVQTSRTSRRNVEEVSGETFAGLFGDFGIALYADSVPGTRRSLVSTRYQLGNRTLRELLARTLGRPVFPLDSRLELRAGERSSGSMVQATFNYLTLRAPATGGVTLQFSAPAAGTFPRTPRRRSASSGSLRDRPRESRAQRQMTRTPQSAARPSAASARSAAAVRGAASFVALLVLAPRVQAQAGGRNAGLVLDLPASARAAALAGAYAAVGGDDAALFYNPAQLATVTRGAGLSIERYLASSTLAALSAATRVGRGTAAVGVQSLRYGSVAEVLATGPADEPAYVTGREISASDVAISAGYAVAAGRVRVGAAAKYAQQSIAGTSGGAVAVDAGVAVPVGRGSRWPRAAQNLGGDLRIAGVSSPLPRRLRIGASLPLAVRGAVDVLVVADVANVERAGTTAGAGAEVTWRAPGPVSLDARVGYRQQPSGAAAPALTLGGGVGVGRLALDYAYRGHDALGATHRVGVRWR
jgi:hypothetical protein